MLDIEIFKGVIIQDLANLAGLSARGGVDAVLVATGQRWRLFKADCGRWIRIRPLPDRFVFFGQGAIAFKIGDRQRIIDLDVDGSSSQSSVDCGCRDQRSERSERRCGCVGPVAPPCRPCPCYQPVTVVPLGVLLGAPTAPAILASVTGVPVTSATLLSDVTAGSTLLLEGTFTTLPCGARPVPGQFITLTFPNLTASAGVPVSIQGLLTSIVDVDPVNQPGVVLLTIMVQTATVPPPIGGFDRAFSAISDIVISGLGVTSPNTCGLLAAGAGAVGGETAARLAQLRQLFISLGLDVNLLAGLGLNLNAGLGLGGLGANLGLNL